MSDGCIVIDTPEGIKAYRMLALKAALTLEIVGMRARRGFSTLKTIKQETGLKARTAKEMLPLYVTWLKEHGYLV